MRKLAVKCTGHCTGEYAQPCVSSKLLILMRFLRSEGVPNKASVCSIYTHWSLQHWLTVNAYADRYSSVGHCCTRLTTRLGRKYFTELEKWVINGTFWYVRLSGRALLLAMSQFCVWFPGPDVSLSTSVLDFSLTNVAETVTRVLEIRNDSAAQTCYQFKIDCHESVFKFDETVGELAAGETRKVIVVFCPSHAINYYRRVACVIANQVCAWSESVQWSASWSIN